MLQVKGHIRRRTPIDDSTSHGPFDLKYMAVTRLFLHEAKTLNRRNGGRRKKIGWGFCGPPKNASPRLSSISCSLVDRTSKLSTNHRKDWI